MFLISANLSRNHKLNCIQPLSFKIPKKNDITGSDIITTERHFVEWKAETNLWVHKTTLCSSQNVREALFLSAY